MWKALILLSLLTVASCGGGALSLLTGGGPNVAANVQAGAENNQGINIKTGAPSVSLRPNARVDTVDQSSVTNNELPPLVWVVFILTWIIGWVTDTPTTMFKNLFRKESK